MANPVEQFVIKAVSEDSKFSFNGIDLTYTNSSLWMTIGLVLSITFLTIAMKKKEMVPGRLQMTAELLYEFVAKMAKDNIGPKGRAFFPFVFTIFVFVLMGNLLGLLPGGILGLPKVFTYTSHLAVTGALALMVFFAVILFGFINHGFKFFSLFVPSGVPWWILPVIIPIELVSFFVRPITLSVRLFANMMAGHLMLKIIMGFSVAAAGLGGAWAIAGILPAIAGMGLLLFELLVAFIQAYVFAILTCVYLKDAVDLHH
jgi:F-type H+-transporting ATPase subunit a